MFGKVIKPTVDKLDSTIDNFNDLIADVKQTFNSAKDSIDKTNDRASEIKEFIKKYRKPIIILGGVIIGATIFENIAMISLLANINRKIH